MHLQHLLILNKDKRAFLDCNPRANVNFVSFIWLRNKIKPPPTGIEVSSVLLVAKSTSSQQPQEFWFILAHICSQPITLKHRWMVNFIPKSDSMFVKILELIPKLVFVSKQCTLEFFWTTNLVGLNPSGLPPSSQCKTCSTNFPCKNQTFVFSLSANWYFHLISQVFVVLVTVRFLSSICEVIGLFRELRSVWELWSDAFEVWT